MNDHQNAVYLAEQLGQIDGISIDINEVQSNVVVFDVTKGTNNELVQYLSKYRVYILHEFGSFRLKTNLHVTAAKIDRLIMLVKQYFAEKWDS